MLGRRGDNLTRFPFFARPVSVCCRTTLAAGHLAGDPRTLAAIDLGLLDQVVQGALRFLTFHEIEQFRK